MEKLAENGLTIEVPAEGYAHYDRGARRIVYPLPDLLQDQEIPYRDYMILHEFAHAIDFLLEPSRDPLSDREDLGIASHRRALREQYQPLLRRFEAMRGQPGWGSGPGGHLARVYGEDFITVVEAVTGERLAERPARGHLTILDEETRNTEYFADAVYTYLHSEPVTVHHYRLPDGREIDHAYPPTRAQLRERDPRMYEALRRFVSSGGVDAAALKIER
ncbi:MAG: hypothetical protein HY319_04140 [Armatimonadetes bacterium]|nr:hypothetical protein [Armatimonadota bacterium]